MDYPVRRLFYLTKYSDYLERLVLNKELIAKINIFSPVLWANDQTPTDEALKSCILLELTRTRESCDRIIRFLEDSNEGQNKEIAEGLKKINRTTGRISYGDNTCIYVTPWLSHNDIRQPNSINYPMTKRIRGKALIYNIVPSFVRHESARFVSIFEQLFFEVQMRYSSTTAEISDELESISQEMVNNNFKLGEKDEAIVVMVISHGRDAQICGRDHPSCSRIPPTDSWFDTAIEDSIPISHIVDIFAKTNKLGIVKAFFFICCQEIKEDYINPKYKMCSTSDGNDTHLDTFVHYSCAEGYESKIEPSLYYTPYGRALSEAIAQYSHNEDLEQIMKRTNSKMRETHNNAGGNLLAESGKYAPGSYTKCPTRKLFFNPGWHKQMDEVWQEPMEADQD